MNKGVSYINLECLQGGGPWSHKLRGFIHQFGVCFVEIHVLCMLCLHCLLFSQTATSILEADLHGSFDCYLYFQPKQFEFYHIPCIVFFKLLLDVVQGWRF